MMRFQVMFAVVCLATFHSSAFAQQQESSGEKATQYVGSIEEHHADLNKLIDENEKIEVLTTGFQWSEGPVWIKSQGHLLFSDVPQNKIHQWSPATGHSVFMDPSGYEGDNGEKEPGSNGLMADAEGRLVGLRPWKPAYLSC